MNISPLMWGKIAEITYWFCQLLSIVHLSKSCRAQGTIVTVGLRYDGMEVAVKRMLRIHYPSIKNELEKLRMPELEHPNIVKYRVSSNNHIFFISSYTINTFQC